jgi:ATP-dependent DNA ligase
VPAQPVERDKPPAGADWVHEIKHDGYRLIVRRDGAMVRLWTRNAVDYTDRLSTIVAAVSAVFLGRRVRSLRGTSAALPSRLERRS